MFQKAISLHPAQHDIFMDQLIYPDSSHYNTGGYLKITGSLDKEKFAAAVYSLPAVFDALRMRFGVTDDIPHMYFDDSYLSYPMEEVDASDIPDNSAVMEQWIKDRLNIPFRLGKDPLLYEYYLININEGEYWWYFKHHHLLIDGIGLAAVFQYVAKKYNALVKGEEVTFSFPSYRDEAIKAHAYYQSEDYAREGAYWKTRIGEKPDSVLKKRQGTAHQKEGGTYLLDIANEDRAWMDELEKRSGVSLQQLTIAALLIYFAKSTLQTSIIFGVPLHKRRTKQLRTIPGIFMGVIPFKGIYQPDITLIELLKQIASSQREDYRYQNYLVSDLKKMMQIGHINDYLIEVIVNYALLDFEIQMEGGVKATTSTLSNPDLSFPLELMWKDYGKQQPIQLRMDYQAQFFSAEEMPLIAQRLMHILHQFKDSLDAPVGQISILPDEEEHELLSAFNATAVAYPPDQTWLDLFVSQVSRTPEATAVVFKDIAISYQQLEERSNQLAHYLQSLGVKEETLVPICLERSVEMIIGILGILKAGAAYVPIDPDYPEDRIRFMLSDTGAGWLLSDRATASRLHATGNIQVITLDDDRSSIDDYPNTAPSTSLTPASLAYVIYTSGTTGQPKGVMNEHGGLLNRLLWTQDYFKLDSTDAVLQKTTFCFDVSVWELLWPLITGAKLVFALPEEHRNADYLKAVIAQQGITTIHFVPSMLHAFLENIKTGDCPGLRRVLCSGEALLPQQVQAFKQKKIRAGLYNLYGPTEAAIDVTCWPVPEDDVSPEMVPIGKPVANTSLYILDASGHIAPIGVPGELHIGGVQVARGYLNRPELTAQKFINDPFAHTAHARMYRTGDQARWLPDGNIEYLGRKDDQVKIRGYRIETGEIESVMMQCELVSQAVVVPRADNQGLIGYVVPRGDFDKNIILAYLQSRLPGYMVPAFLIPLDKLPLSTNGKVDKKALPAVDVHELLTEDYVAPRNEREQILADIWQELLLVSRVGIYDNFFELGGDSIITIQVVSRARRSGYELQPRDLFACQTIAALSAFLLKQENTRTVGEQGILTGNSGLLPVQQFYFETTNNTGTHFNQSLLLKVSKTASADKLSRVITQLVRHHDALRFGYQYQRGTWEQTYGSEEPALEILDLRGTDPAFLSASIAVEGEKFQRSTDIGNGILFKAVLVFTPDEEEENRLLLIVHHLAVDGVSWRILLEDAVLLLNADDAEMTSVLGHKGSSYRQWYHALDDYSKLPRLLNQQSYWEKITERFTPSIVENVYEGPVTMADTASLVIKLDAAQTQSLLQEAPKAYHTEINDILLSALALTLTAWNDNHSVVVGLEGHGREDITTGIDINRTVGWFTSMYPVLLEVKTRNNNASLIKEVKEQLRKITDKGIGYGVLKYINQVASLRGNTPWDILFNYLGQLDSLVARNAWLSAPMESLSLFASEEHRVHEKIAIDSYIQEGVLVVNWRYSTRHYSLAGIEKLASDYLSNLQMLIDHCASQRAVSFTPADYGLGAYIDHEALDKFLDAPYGGMSRRQQLTGLYRLTGLQEGILFHSLYNQQSDVYLEQLTCDLGAFNETILLQGLQHLVQQHTILRSVFYYDEFSVPVQCVLRDVQLPVTVLDYRHLNESEQQKAIAQYEEADRRLGFDFNQAPLTRFCLIRLEDDHYRLIWTFHHILLDGWSLPILLAELLQYYETAITGEKPAATVEDRFGDFIRYLDYQDKDQSLQYWSDYLRTMSEGCLLPFIGAVAGRTKGVGVYKEHLLQLDTLVSDRIALYARRHHITQNTLMQGVWSYLLYRYTGRKDIAFGITVAGRPEELQGVEQRVGMFINTLPLYTTVERENGIVAWLQQLQESQQESRKYQYTGLKDIQQRTGITGDLFDTSITFQNYPLNSVLALKDWQLKITNLAAHPHTNYPLTIIIHTGTTTRLLFSYNNDLLDTFYVQQIAAQFNHVLLQIVDDQVEHINNIELLTSTERELLLSANNQLTLTGTDQTILDNFAAVVARTPQATALVFEGKTLSYQELNQRSDRLAAYLHHHGVGANTLVPLFIERSADMIVGILGILKAGGAYVPIEQDYPQERISYILKDTAATLIVSSSTCRGLLPSTMAQVVSLDEELSVETILSLPRPSAEQLLYVIYTSGSTGAPKGVMVTHRNLTDYLSGLQAAVPITDCHSFALLTGIATDLGNTVLYGSLASGGKLHLFSKAFINDSEKLHTYFESHRIDCIKVVPSYWKAVSAPDRLLLPEKLLIFGGEALETAVVDSIQATGKGCTIVNHYGPTETTIGKLLHVVNDHAVYGPHIPIGKPFSNTRVYVLSPAMELCPAGIPGELYIGGDGVAAGYLHNETLTAERFIDDPFLEGGRLYRTGDIVKYAPDGNILFIGRGDDQVKIRGYRVELGEIERTLNAYESVEQGVVVVRGEAKTLVGYVTAARAFDKSDLLSYLKAQLPDYMVPAQLVVMEQFPLLNNGKIDRRALPDPETAGVATSTYAAPVTELETALAAIWSLLLEVPQVGLHDDFFALGGHSLLAIRLISAMRKQLSVEVTIADVFDYPTISQLSAQLDQRAGNVLMPAVTRQERPGRIPLSYSQERLWFIDQLEGSTNYHVAAAFKLEGTLDRIALSMALQTIVDRHEVLRTVITEEEGTAYQHVLDAGLWQLQITEGLANLNQDLLEEHIRSFIETPFDLSTDHKLRAQLIVLGETTHVLVITLHHIASDGWSSAILIKELVELYSAFLNKRPAQLEELSIQYADYAIWQRKHLSGTLLDKKLGYWKNKLTETHVLQLPYDYPRTPFTGKRGAYKYFQLDSDLSAQLKAFSQQQGVTMYMTLLTVLKVLLYRYTGEEDISVGSPTAGRTQQEVEGLIGFFINTLVLRSDLKDNPSFVTLLQQVKQTTLDAYAHQEAPFEKVVEAVVTTRDLTRHPLFQVMFVWQNMPDLPALRFGDVQLSEVPVSRTTSQLDLTLSLQESQDGLLGTIQYFADLFSEETVVQLIGQYEALLRAVIQAPEERIGTLKLLDKEDGLDLMKTFNDNVEAYPEDKTIDTLFAEQAVLHPLVTAVVAGGQTLSYNELEQRSNQLAHYLQHIGVNNGTYVGICIERSLEMIVGILGILKAGAAYVPIDPDYPSERISHILTDTDVQVILSSHASKGAVENNTGIIILLDGDRNKIDTFPVTALSRQVQSSAAAYVIYTSGSTGKPKGVIARHRGVVNLIHCQSKAYQITPEERILMTSDYSFDASVEQLFFALLNGVTVVLADKEVLADMTLLEQLLHEQRISHLEVTPGLLSNITAGKYSALKRIVSGGEACRSELAERWSSYVDFYNIYGPTETTISALIYQYTGSRSYPTGTLPIGKPLANVRVYILDNEGHPVPVGVKGELYIGGAGVTAGYLNNPELTAARFIRDPFTDEPGATMYRSGDTAKWLPDGNILYLGRADEQVKVRGYRIELGEIERVLQQSGLVKQVVVHTKQDGSGTRQLVGYVVPSAAGFDKGPVMNYLKQHLPDYMVPALWVALETLPLTANGKVDRKKLPEPEISASMDTYTAPRNEMEHTLAAIWQEQLQIQRIGVHDNFFELGGHSLLAIRLITVIRKQLQTALSVKDLFSYPSVAALAAFIAQEEYNTPLPVLSAQPRPARVPLSYSQERLWFIDHLEGSVHYHIPMVLKLKGNVSRSAMERALQTIINRHEVLRTVIVEEDGVAYQSVLPANSWAMDTISAPVDVTSFLEHPFVLSADHMLRAGWLQVAAGEYVMALVLHHIAADGWSMPVIMEELSVLYTAYAEEREVLLPDLELQYADYALWQRSYVSGVVLERQQTYWKERLSGITPLELPLDYQRPAMQDQSGGKVHYSVDAKVADAMRRYSQQQGVTLFTTMLSVLKVLLYRYTGQDDICIGSAVAGRGLHEFDKLIGCFVNTLALRSRVDGSLSFTTLLQQVKTMLLSAYEHQDLPFEKVVELVVEERDLSRSPLFDVMFQLQNIGELEPVRLKDITVSAEFIEHRITKFDLTFGVIETAEGFILEIEYSKALFREATILQMAAHYAQLLKSVAATPDRQISILPILTQPDEQLLSKWMSGPVVNYGANKHFVQLFEEQVLKSPEVIAVVHENNVLTYRELDERANQLSHYLRDRGVTTDSLVAICLNKGVDMLVSILGIWKAGGAYIPIDPNYPDERIHYILEDAAAGVMICNKPVDIAGKTLVINPDNPDILENQPVIAPVNITAPGDLSYVIYTSGSTGKPKGVLVEHRGMLNHLFAKIDDLEMDAGTVLAFTASYTFDISVWQMFAALLCGGRTVIYSDDLVLQPSGLIKQVEEDAVTILELVPSYLSAVLQEETGVTLTRLQYLLVTGEAVRRSLLEQWFSHKDYGKIPVVNAYGPTEASDDITHHFMYQTPGDNNVPLGKPVRNLRIYILNDQGQLCPAGITGEICVSGIGVSRGYLNRPDLTAARFVADPFRAGERMYKTGDAGKWLPDGTIAYLGRTDEQVKIRGYRIELGEIESVLQSFDQVSQCAVIAKADKQGNKQLIGYVVAKEFDREAAITYLQQQLPEYMVPLLIVLDALPLTANGKIDRKALPDPSAEILSTDEYVAPRNETEQLLADIWKGLLGVTRVGIHDNFFRLGGDSIITIQMVSRAKRAGYELQVKEVFLYPTVARLSTVMAARKGATAASAGEQGILEGTAGLLPIQQHFFEEALENAAGMHHYNQRVLLALDKDIDEVILSAVLQRLQEQHDALRFAYHQKEGEWIQQYSTHYSRLATEDLRQVPAEAVSLSITACCEQYQQSLDIASGDVVRMVFIQTPQTESHNRLLLVIHHLAVDSVSWRILLEDTGRLLQAALDGKSVDLGAKSASYRGWYNELQDYSKGARLLSQARYWEKVVQAAYHLPVDNSYDGIVRMKDINSHTMRLETELTRQLLQDASKAYQTEINDLLLAALARTLSDWSGSEEVVIGLEGHGREDLGTAINTDRTVGWFTSLYPVLLHAGSRNESGLIKSVKEQLRELPDKGIGYGVLKYIHKTAALQHIQPWDIVFNYLGQIDTVSDNDSKFFLAKELGGENISKEHMVRERLMVNGQVQHGLLTLVWSYSSKHYEADTIEKIAALYYQHLVSLIIHCAGQAKQATIPTPSDYGLTGQVKYQQLDKFLAAKAAASVLQLSTVYPLSGLQEGMLFHGLYDDGSKAYIEQFTCDIEGGNVGWLEQSWNYLLKRHSILRTAFDYQSLGIPVQCVYEKAKIPFEILDYREMDTDRQETAIAEYLDKDRALGFDFTSVPLMRITLFRTGAHRYRMLWSFHHILLDGWSLPVVLEELLESYEALSEGRPQPAFTEDRYEDYIRYIGNKDKWKEEAYWREYMKEVETGSLLPFIAAGETERTRGGGTYEDIKLRLDASLHKDLENYAQHHGLTVNTVMQGVWAFILHVYTGNKDVTFGVTVSGRPGDLPDVEQRVGIYINTLPLHQQIDADKDITQWLKDIQLSQIASRDYEHTALGKIQTWTGVSGDLFDSLLIFENYPVSEVIAGKQWKLKLSNLGLKEQTNYPLNITISSSRETNVTFSYNKDLLEEVYVTQLSGHFREVLQQLVGTEKVRLGDIDLLTGTERSLLLNTFSGPVVHYPEQLTVMDVFEEYVLKSPDAVAVLYNNNTLSYRELNKQANQLAHYLRSVGVTKDNIVAICMNKGFDMIVSVLGIWKAGGAYVPIDPGYPEERISFMLEDTGAKVMICNKDISSTGNALVVRLDNPEVLRDQPVTSPVKITAPGDLAYAIYTSGSTGKPKGTMVEHAGLLNHSLAMISELKMDSTAALAFTATYTFDISVWQMTTALLCGGRTVIYGEELVLQPSALIKQAEVDRISILELVPSYLSAVLDAETGVTLKCLQYLLVTGEAVNRPLLEQWFSHKDFGKIPVVNAYGPTEASDDITLHFMYSAPEGNLIPVGKPVQNLHIYVIDQDGRLCPWGVTGEICVSGIGVGRGYLNRPDLTAAKFVADPFREGNRMYRTGDLGKWLPDGTVVYLGRTDEQVKIRGYRIELGEIENILQSSEEVNQCTVIAKADKQGNKRLIAYVVPTATFSRETIGHYLKEKLPAHMIPSLIVEMKQLPLTAHGKVDKKALPDPDVNEWMADQYVAPRNETEQTLANICAQLLQIERVGIHDNLFELGMNSLLIMRLDAAVQDEFRMKIAVRTFFELSTVELLAGYILLNQSKPMSTVEKGKTIVL
ncbi:non-ribosomal peptide synthase/polyketide synthase [Chitinophaga flava]|uniref:Carrier domain-containing protein n=1 Tax=Chitinophaga flava TaxID=2259036 RepID=A0A365XYA6_9BACT|nr:non-ribosomal peptide synthase/polyketide synthase [Chitinophaga flava]RBL91356.1 hypothetical protein DF182_01665 [Chitinophaga flava]